MGKLWNGNDMRKRWLAHRSKSKRKQRIINFGWSAFQLFEWKCKWTKTVELLSASEHEQTKRNKKHGSEGFDKDKFDSMPMHPFSILQDAQSRGTFPIINLNAIKLCFLNYNSFGELFSTPSGPRMIELANEGCLYLHEE